MATTDLSPVFDILHYELTDAEGYLANLKAGHYGIKDPNGPTMIASLTRVQTLKKILEMVTEVNEQIQEGDN